MMVNTYIGIDPGKMGAVAVITDEGHFELYPGTSYCNPEYDPKEMHRILRMLSEPLYLVPEGSRMHDLNPGGAVEVFTKELPQIASFQKKVFCVIERAQAMPGQGVVSMFEFGRGYGMWLALLSANEIPFQVVHSRTWTKDMLMGAPGEGKDRSYNMARRLFPKWEPKHKYERQYSDALLLAEYGRRKQNGQG
jgi:hypothetical protein